jgi:hypothetical protein
MNPKMNPKLVARKRLRWTVVSLLAFTAALVLELLTSNIILSLPLVMAGLWSYGAAKYWTGWQDATKDKK